MLRDFTKEDVAKIADAYHAWRGSAVIEMFNDQRKNVSDSGYADEAGFCKSSNLQEITTHGHVLTPGRYVGAEDVEDDGEPFEDKMTRLVADLKSQFSESAKLEKAIKANLSGLGYGE